MGHLLALRCDCGYRADNLVSDGLFSGVAEVFICRDCLEVVSALVWSSGYLEEIAPGPVAPECPRCGGRDLERFGDGGIPAGPCPRCGRQVATESIGIAD